MAKVLFVSEKNVQSAHELHSKMVQESFDCEYSTFEAEPILQKTQIKSVELVVVYLHEMTEFSKKELAYILTHEKEVAFMLCGSREELHKYYATCDAKIIRYLLTPIKVSDFIEVVRQAVNKIEGIPEVEDAPKIEIEHYVDKRKHVLIVDDDPVSLRTVVNWLKDDYVTSVAKSGAQALSCLGKEIPDLILLDYEMPVMSGVQTLEAIRSEEAFSKIPVIFLTAISEMELVKEAIKYKPEGYLLKSEGKDLVIAKIIEVFANTN